MNGIGIRKWSVLMSGCLTLSLAAVLLPVVASGSTLAFTATLATPESVFETVFLLPSSSTVTFQTWGFGGGTDAKDQPIPAGGFDPLISLFSGPPATATIYVDGSGNPLADADNLSNPPWSYVVSLDRKRLGENVEKASGSSVRGAFDKET
jgi:hypothetical protein